ncbi:MAG: 50S ribosomal protein L35 [candidate division WOR-3 bacterium]
MPKLKTKRTLMKRVKLTKSGKILARRSGKGHLLTGKSQKRKRRLRKTTTYDKMVARRLKSMLNL